MKVVFLLAAVVSSSSFASVHRWIDSDSTWQTIQFVDLNHDGKQDVCGRDYDGIQCALSDGEKFGPLATWSAEFSNSRGWGAADNWWKTIQFPDVTGDGLPDVCARRSDGIVCGVSDGSSFGPLTLWADEYKNAGGWQSTPAYWSTIRFPDLNGDGKADVCGRGIYGLLCALSDGAGFLQPSVWSASFKNGSSFDRAPNYGTFQYVDLNGDGMLDVCGRGVLGAICAISSGTSFLDAGKWSLHFSDGGSWQIPRYALTVFFRDLDGDGKADVCGRGEAFVYCQLGDGRTFLANKPWTNRFADQDTFTNEVYWGTVQFADVNADGKADICGRRSNGIYCGLAGAETFTINSSPQFSDAEGWNTNRYYWQTIRFVDVDGDGNADTCGRFYDGMRCALANGSGRLRPASVWSAEFGD